MNLLPPREKLLWGSPKNSTEGSPWIHGIHGPIDMELLVNQKYFVCKKQWIVPSPCNSGDDYRLFYFAIGYNWTLGVLNIWDLKTAFGQNGRICQSHVFCSQECPLESSCGHCFQWPGWGRKGLLSRGVGVAGLHDDLWETYPTMGWYIPHSGHPESWLEISLFQEIPNDITLKFYTKRSREES